jgi:hypothetical protein
MTREPTTRTPRLLGTAQGYVLGDERVEGFEDRSDLPETARILIAQWAARLSEKGPSDEQQKLLETSVLPEPSSADVEEVRAAVQDAEEDVPQALRLGLYDVLQEEERERARFPSRYLDNARSYPLAVSDLAKLTGATPKQVRHWDDMGLLPGHRVGNERRF